MSAIQPRGVNVDLPDGRTVEVPPIVVDGDVMKPDVLTIRRGPYNAFVIVARTDEFFEVVPPIYVENKRPAILDPEDVINFDRIIRADSVFDIRRPI